LASVLALFTEPCGPCAAGCTPPINDDSEQAAALGKRIGIRKKWILFLEDVRTEALKRLTIQDRTVLIWVCSHSMSVDDDALLIIGAFKAAPLDQAQELTDYLLGDERSQLRRLENVLGGEHLEKFYLAIAPVMVASKSEDKLADPGRYSRAAPERLARVPWHAVRVRRQLEQ
jgi:hypothetical protein